MKKGLIEKMQNNNKQLLVNKNMEQLFDLPENSTPMTVADRMKNIIRPEKTEKQSSEAVEPPVKKKRAPYKTKSPTRGGKREGSGRPKGSTNKITPTDMLDDFQQKAGMSFHEFINQQIVDAHNSGNSELVSKYLLGFAKYLVQDVQEIKQDITSNGQTMGVAFNFPSNELPDWQDEQLKH